VRYNQRGCVVDTILDGHLHNQLSSVVASLRARLLARGPGAASAGQIAADTGYCQVSSIPLDPSNALVGLRLSRTSFLGITRENSTANIELINLSSVSLDRVAVIVQYLEASDRVVLRIPFYATSTDENLSHPSFPLPSPDKVVGSSERENWTLSARKDLEISH